MERKLGGYSGCSVMLVEENDGQKYVRKTSSSIEYNDRLIKQCQKQFEFESDVIKTPAILNKGYNEDNLFFFEMEYIPGIVLSERIKTVEVGKIQGYIDALFSCMRQKDNLIYNHDSVGIFDRKIDELRIEVSCHDEEFINKAIDLLKGHDWSCYSKSYCHGDLTLENIIVKDDVLYFIDFLDSFYDSWFLDAATILQDVECMWSYRRENAINNNTKIRLMIFRDILLDKIKTNDISILNEIQYGLLLKLIRIYPYVDKGDLETKSFLNKAVMRIYREITNGE